MKANAVLPEGSGPHAGQEVTLTALVKEVKAKKLPPLDDEFAKAASEFDTLAELREDLRTKLGELKAAEVQHVIRDLVLAKLVEDIRSTCRTRWSTRRPRTGSTARCSVSSRPA